MSSALRRVVLPFAVLPLLAAPSAFGQANPPAVTAFVDVNVVPMDSERVLPHQTVLVVDGKIANMGPHIEVPANARTIDGHGTAYLAPVQPVQAGRGSVLVITAGTSDLPVAEEAAVTATALGNCVTRLADVGVAGIHRLLSRREELLGATVIVVVAGMDGALPSVVGGLVRVPVIAVPTSVGYGASFQGLAALLTMLNSCAAGITVVNIDNGFGAAVAASRINHV